MCACACGGAREGGRNAPFCWYEAAPTLLRQDAVETLGPWPSGRRDSAAGVGLPLGLILIDTVAASAG
jgi:hypothetical protein